MRFTFIVAIILSILITIFALSNNEDVTINYLFGQGKIVKALLIFLLIGAGAMITLLFSIPNWWQNRKEKSNLRKQNAKLSEELSQVRSQYLKSKQSSTQPPLSKEDEDFTRDVEKE